MGAVMASVMSSSSSYDDDSYTGGSTFWSPLVIFWFSVAGVFLLLGCICIVGACVQKRRLRKRQLLASASPLSAGMLRTTPTVQAPLPQAVSPQSTSPTTSPTRSLFDKFRRPSTMSPPSYENPPAYDVERAVTTNGAERSSGIPLREDVGTGLTSLRL